MKCLEKDPARRHASAQDLAEELGRCLRGEPTRTRPLRWPVRLGRAAWRFGKRYTWAGLIPLICGLAVWWVILNTATTDPGHRVKKDQAKKSPDPDRALKQIQSKLARGEKATLIGEKGKPAWRRWATGEGAAQVSPAGDGTFSFSSWTLSLLELVRDPQYAHYEFRASVRQDKGEERGEVGIFVALSKPRTSQGVLLYFCQVSYDDIHQMLQGPPGVKFKPSKPPLLNPVKLEGRLYREARLDSTLDGTMVGRANRLLKPAGFMGGEWRKLVVTVSPEGVKATFKGKKVGSFTFREMETETRKSLTTGPTRNPALANFRPRVNPRGSLGLYILKSSASFRNVVVKPLTGIH
jgi:hypothetical protein